MFRQDIEEIADFSLGGTVKFKDTACALCSTLHIVEQIKGVFFSPWRVKKLCQELLHQKIIDKEFYIESWDKIFSYLGVPVKTHFEAAEYTCREHEVEILKLVKPGHTHFAPGDGKGHYSWDSLGRRKAQKDYELAEKRVFTLMGGK